MKKIKYLFLLVLLPLSLSTFNVYAVSNAVKGDCNFNAKGSYSNGHGTISIGGKNYAASCEDAGLSALKGDVHCQQVASTKYGTSPQEKLANILQEKYKIQPGSDYYTLAVRFLEVQQGTYADTKKMEVLKNFYRLPKDEQRKIYDDNRELFGSLSFGDARSAADKAKNSWNDYVKDQEHHQPIDTSATPFDENNSYIQPLIAKFDDEVKLKPLAGGDSITIECYTGSGKNSNQRYTITLDECPVEEDDKCVDKNGDGYDDKTGEPCEDGCIDKNGDGYDDKTGEPCEDGCIDKNGDGYDDKTGEPCEEEEDEGSTCPPMTPSISGTMNNCCKDEPTRDELKQDELKNLFCENKELGVKYYEAKGGTGVYLDAYANGQLASNDPGIGIQNYCSIYCTQRAIIEQPGAITATNGRYFKLTSTTAGGTTSAYVETYKRCRTLVNYHKWVKEYYNIVKDEVKGYNNFQEGSSGLEIYDKMQKPTYEYTSTCTVSCMYLKETNEKGQKIYDTTSIKKEVTKSYMTYYFPLNESSYYAARINPDYHNKGTKTYTQILVEPALKGEYAPEASNACFGSSHQGSGKYLSKHPDKKTYNPEVEQNLIADAEQACTLARAACSSMPEGSPGGESPDYTKLCVEEAEQMQERLIGLKESGEGLYNDSIDKALKMEKGLYVCDAYFRVGDYGSHDLPQAYDVNANMEFSYVQTYVDERMSCVTDQQYVKFLPINGNSSAGLCNVSGPTSGPDGADGLEGYLYSDEYGQVFEKMTDFHKHGLTYSKGNVIPDHLAKGESEKPGGIFNARKIFNDDAKYKAICYKNEDDFITQTTIPDGLTLVPDKSTEKKYETNFTTHNREYYIYITTLNGKYETFWEISGVGEGAVFDNTIMSESTCSGHTANGSYLPGDMTCGGDRNVELNGPVYTCQLTILSQVIETGKCNDPETPNCEYEQPKIHKEGYNFFNFKIVDPKNLFPSCDSYSAGGSNSGACNYAWNWLGDSKGVAAKNEIESKAKNQDATYSKDNLTYSVKLTSKDLETIKKYNKAVGSYDDFNLKCDCPGEVNCDKTVDGENTCVSNKSCHTCQSSFMQGLYSGQLSYKSFSESVTRQESGNNMLANIRKNNRWQVSL